MIELIHIDYRNFYYLILKAASFDKHIYKCFSHVKLDYCDLCGTIPVFIEILIHIMHKIIENTVSLVSSIFSLDKRYQA